MNATFKKLLMGLSLIAVGNGAWAQSPPPNTLDLTGQSPVIAAAPSAIQPNIVPSVSNMVQGEIQNYINAQPTPEQMEWLKRYGLEVSRVSASPYVDIPRPVVRSMAVNLAPGEAPPIVRLAKGMVTSIVVTDNEGNPWTVEKVVLNQQQFANHTSTNSEGETNIITIEPNDAMSWSNMSVTLKDKAVPVIFLLTAGQAEVDLRVDARVPGLAPSGQKSAGEYVGLIGSHSNITMIDNDTLHFLDGTIPMNAERMTTTDPYVEGWLYNDSLYVKTRFDVSYPNFHAKSSTAEKVHVYRFDNALNAMGMGSVTFTQRGGQPITVFFEKNHIPYYQK